MPTDKLAAKRRAWWWQRQGLDGSLAGASPAGVLARTGWARSVAGATPYLTFFSRAGLRRATVDAAVARLEVHELPAARGCTYVVPSDEFGLALLAGRGFDTDWPVALKLGVTETELVRLSAAVLGALRGGPLAPNEIRREVGPACRDLGDAGARKGLSSTLSLALGRLQAEGRIRRVPVNGRLDQQRYRYALWTTSPRREPSQADADVHGVLASRYFSWIGPARVAEFQAFAGISAAAAGAAVARVHLRAVDQDGEWLMHEEDAVAFAAFTPPRHPQYALVGSLDGLPLLRRDLAALLDPHDLGQRVATDKAVVEIGSLKDLPSHAILDRGRLIGLWEYDPEAASIAWTSFGVKDEALDAAVARTEAFVRDDLGDARSFSLDSPKSRAGRIAALRKAGA
jgi:hypothetical protein